MEEIFLPEVTVGESTTQFIICFPDDFENCSASE